MTDKTGGAAFPTHGGYPGDDPRNQILGGGLTIRDWFAGQALIGLLSGQYSDNSRANLMEVPEEAYKIADALLSARDEG